MAETRFKAVEGNHDAPAAWRGMIAAFLRYLEARGQLAQLEAQEALGQLAWALVFGVVAAMALALGAWVLVVPAGIWMICEKMHWPLDRALVIAGVVHGIVAVLFLRGMLTRLRASRWFAETLVQFGRDRSWLAQETEKN